MPDNDISSMTPEEKAYLEQFSKNVAENRPVARPGSQGGSMQRRMAPASEPSSGRGAIAPARQIEGPPLNLQAGAILSLNDGSVGLFKEAPADKEYQLVYFLEPDGKINPQGVVLKAYKVRHIGQLPADFLADIQRSHRWSRDAIVFHVGHWSDLQFLPPAASYISGMAPTVGGISAQGGKGGAVPPPSGEYRRVDGSGSSSGYTESRSGGGAAAMRAPGLPSKDEVFVIGRKFKIKFGDRDWEAIYWGKDDLGSIVAHCTNRVWSIMHLDLSRFKDNFEAVGMLSEVEINQIKQSLDSVK